MNFLEYQETKWYTEGTNKCKMHFAQSVMHTRCVRLYCLASNTTVERCIYFAVSLFAAIEYQGKFYCDIEKELETMRNVKISPVQTG